MSELVQDFYTESDFEELLDSARMNAANDWEESFVSDMKSKYDQYGRRMYISDAQQQALERIANDN